MERVEENWFVFGIGWTFYDDDDEPSGFVITGKLEVIMLLQMFVAHLVSILRWYTCHDKLFFQHFSVSGCLNLNFQGKVIKQWACFNVCCLGPQGSGKS
jgi:hypothetical protein